MRYCTAISKKSRFELSRNISSRRPLPPSVKRKRSKAAKGGKKSSGAGSERVPEPACIRVNGRRLPCVCVCVCVCKVSKSRRTGRARDFAFLLTGCAGKPREREREGEREPETWWYVHCGKSQGESAELAVSTLVSRGCEPTSGSSSFRNDNGTL